MRLLRLGSIVVVTLLLAPASAHAFAVEFVRVRGNNDWVETNVTPVDNDGAVTAVDAVMPNKALARVEARIDSGSWFALTQTGTYSWGQSATTN